MTEERAAGASLGAMVEPGGPLEPRRDRPRSASTPTLTAATPAAGDLAEDLRRFLDDQPLKHAPEPSLRERLAKWARRHPRLSGDLARSGGMAASLDPGLGRPDRDALSTT